MNEPILVKIDPILAELVPRFLERCGQTATEFCAAAESGDLATARRIGHSLLGTASSYGFQEMAAMGKEIETAARNGDVEALKALSASLTAHVARVRPVFD
jgi:HPt (histidine-containing phosphotransfer) domain-containing protein